MPTQPDKAFYTPAEIPADGILSHHDRLPEDPPFRVDRQPKFWVDTKSAKGNNRFKQFNHPLASPDGKSAVMNEDTAYYMPQDEAAQANIPPAQLPIDPNDPIRQAMLQPAWKVPMRPLIADGPSKESLAIYPSPFFGPTPDDRVIVLRADKDSSWLFPTGGGGGGGGTPATGSGLTAEEHGWLHAIALKTGAIMLALLFLFSSTAHAQLQVSFSPGVKMAKSVYRWGCIVCNAQPVQLTVDSGWIYQAASPKISPLPPDEVQRIYALDRRHNPLVVLSNTAKYAGLAGALFGASGTIHMSQRALTMLIGAVGIADALPGIIAPELPPGQFGGLLDGRLEIPAGGCITRLVVSRTVHNPQSFTVVVQGNSAPAMQIQQNVFMPALR